MLRLSWSFLQAWVFIEISKIVPCAIPKRFNAVGFRNDEIWFKNRKLASVHLRKTRILVLWNTLEFFIVSGHFPSSTWPRRMFRGQSGCNHRVSNWHFLCKNMGFVWLPERSLLTTGQCYFLRQILSPALSAASVPSIGRVSPCRNRTASHRIRCKLCVGVVICNLNFLALVINGVLSG